MNVPHFSQKEIDSLCRLYMEGLMSSEEEKTLYHLLSTRKHLHAEAQQTLAVMQMEAHIAANVNERKNVRGNLYKWISGIAAVAIIAVLSLGFFLNRPTLETVDETYVVWRDGKKITGAEARAIVEEQERIDMQTLRRVMRLQREQTMGTMAYADINDIE